MEAKYKEELDEAFGIKFNNLFTITNMPIKVSISYTYENQCFTNARLITSLHRHTGVVLLASERFTAKH